MGMNGAAGSPSSSCGLAAGGEDRENAARCAKGSTARHCRCGQDPSVYEDPIIHGEAASVKDAVRLLMAGSNCAACPGTLNRGGLWTALKFLTCRMSGSPVGRCTCFVRVKLGADAIFRLAVVPKNVIILECREARCAWLASRCGVQAFLPGLWSYIVSEGVKESRQVGRWFSFHTPNHLIFLNVSRFYLLDALIEHAVKGCIRQVPNHLLRDTDSFPSFDNLAISLQVPSPIFCPNCRTYAWPCWVHPDASTCRFCSSQQILSLQDHQQPAAPWKVDLIEGGCGIVLVNDNQVANPVTTEANEDDGIADLESVRRATELVRSLCSEPERLNHLNFSLAEKDLFPIGESPLESVVKVPAFSLNELKNSQTLRPADTGWAGAPDFFSAFDARPSVEAEDDSVVRPFGSECTYTEFTLPRTAEAEAALSHFKDAEVVVEGAPAANALKQVLNFTEELLGDSPKAVDLTSTPRLVLPACTGTQDKIGSRDEIDLRASFDRSTNSTVRSPDTADADLVISDDSSHSTRPQPPPPPGSPPERTTRDLYREQYSKTRMCAQFKVGQCKRGSENCKFAHSLQELRATADVYKTKLCAFWTVGHCKAGMACRHAHGEADIRYSKGFSAPPHHATYPRPLSSSCKPDPLLMSQQTGLTFLSPGAMPCAYPLPSAPYSDPPFLFNGLSQKTGINAGLIVWGNPVPPAPPLTIPQPPQQQLVWMRYPSAMKT